MKNTIKIALVCIVVIASLLLPNISNAAETGISITLNRPDLIDAKEQVDASVTLTNNSGIDYSNVRVLVEWWGPSAPELLATDYTGTYDLSQIRYWGPESGFPCANGYTATTPIKATFNTPGKYVISVALVDVSKESNEVVAQEDFIVEVGTVVSVNIDDKAYTYSSTGAASFDSLNIPTPEKEGYTFAGWYTDADFTNELDTTAVLNGSVSVYAKFVKNEEENTDKEPVKDEDKTSEEEKEETKSEEEKDETPKTGVASYLAVAAGVAVVSTMTVVYLRKRNA